MALVTLQARLGYALIGILGEKCLKVYGYPHTCVIRILHHVLDRAGVKACLLLLQINEPKKLLFSSLADCRRKLSVFGTM